MVVISELKKGDVILINKEEHKVVFFSISRNVVTLQNIKTGYVYEYSQEGINETSAEKIEKESSLKNPKSTYYEIFKGLESIDVIEKILTKEELIGAMKYNILKYQLRLGKKDGIENEIEKIKDYKSALEKYLK
tara:strand:+ start:826 stop:1227 length:402 start_codon:yes stop_codon:yes gene_type:complete